MSSGTYTKPLNYATNFNVPLLIHIVVCSSGLKSQTMTVKKLIKELEKMPEDKIVVLTEPDGISWDNIGKVIEDGSTVKITVDGNHPFED